MQIKFEFELDQQVQTPFGEMGIIATLGFDESGRIYYVKTKDGGNWFKESQLKTW
jgi:hypothetical protein